ncbi:MAG: hypothetical protein QNK18_10570 [Gammaproteobacteria bacterium]|nr:hypothetical protein [Gammaproteobacteria bacterium]MDJ0891621.1 hypothetical protein [Gammaproteobacteria bacterium]
MVDILKVIAVLVALIYLNTKAKSRVSSTNYRIMNAGLSLLMFAAILDFTDGIRALDQVPVIGQRAPFHDVLEDQVGDMPGFALFALGAFREIMGSDPVAKLTSGALFNAPRMALSSWLVSK